MGYKILPDYYSQCKIYYAGARFITPSVIKSCVNKEKNAHFRLWCCFQTSHIKYSSIQNLQVEFNISSNDFLLKHSMITINRYLSCKLKLYIMPYVTCSSTSKKPFDYNKSVTKINIQKDITLMYL